MIRFEGDLRTRGEQLFLRALLEGDPLVQCDWRYLRPDDFAHDLHGRIFRHAARLMESHLIPHAATVFHSMREERRGRGLQGVAEYLGLLTGAGVLDCDRSAALAAFFDAVFAQREAREAAQWGGL